MLDQELVICKGDVFYPSEYGYYGVLYRALNKLECREKATVTKANLSKSDRIDNPNFRCFRVSKHFAELHGLSNYIIWVEV